MAQKLNNCSKSLFKCENGKPRSFYMRPCIERKRLKPYIEHGGGTITSNKETHTSIKLREPDSVVTSPGYINSKFIWDCVKANEFLDMSKYRFGGSPGQSDDMSPAQTIIRVCVGDLKGRLKYTTKDDEKIVDYLVREKCYSEVRGKALWRDMELFKVTDHTFESMRTRYLKVILPNIKTYNYPAHVVALITGNTRDAVGKTGSNGTVEGDPTATDETQEPSILQSPTDADHQIQRKTFKDNSTRPGDKLSNSTKPCHQLANSTKPRDKLANSTKPCDMVANSINPCNKLTNSTGTKSPYFRKTRESEYVSDSSDTDDELDKMLLESALVNTYNINDNQNQNNNCTDKNTEVPSKLSTLRSPRKSLKLSDKNDGQMPSTSGMSPISSMSPRAQIMISRGDSNYQSGPKGTSHKPKGTPHKLSPLRPVKVTVVTASSVSCTTAKAGGSPGKVPEVSSQSSAAGRGESFSQENDSYDKHLIACGEKMEEQLRKAFIDSSSEDSDNSSVVPKRKRKSISMLQAEESSKEREETSRPTKQKTPRKSDRVSPKKNKYRNLLLHYVLDNSESQPSQENTSTCSNLSEQIGMTDSELVDFNDYLKGIAKDVGVPMTTMLSALYYNTGSVEEAVHWIKFGQDMYGWPAWTKHDDEILLGTDQRDQLAMEIRHGPRRLRERRLFLEDLHY